MPGRLKSYKLYCPYGQDEHLVWRPIGTAILTKDGWQYECTERIYRPLITQWSGGGSFALIGFLIEKSFHWLIDVTQDRTGQTTYRHIAFDKFLRTAFIAEERGVKGLYSSYVYWTLGKPESYKSTKRRWLPRIKIYGHYAEALLPHLQEQRYFIRGLTEDRIWGVGQPVGGEA